METMKTTTPISPLPGNVQIHPPLATCVPILYGSLALVKQGIPDITPRDMDLICHLKTAQQLAWYANNKVGDHVYSFDALLPIVESEKPARSSPSKTTKLHADTSPSSSSSVSSVSSASSVGSLESRNIVDISLFTDTATTRLLFDMCNNNREGRREVTLQLGDSVSMRVYVPSITWLFALYRGHIHRIPRVSKSQTENIRVWEKYMTRYHAIRAHANYHTLDALVAKPGPEQHIFTIEFDRVTAALGDAPSLDKPEDAFFDDNVTRYIEHDELHKRVALMNRGPGALPLYPRFQADPTSVNMDKELFFAPSVTPQERLDTIREELMVLYLERKVLPAVVECNDRLAVFEGFNEIVCHFITNLCGSGHSWLRQYCLDHWHMVNDLLTYPRQKMRAFANTFRKEAMVLEDGAAGSMDRIETLAAFMAYHTKVQANKLNENVKIHNDMTNRPASEYLDKIARDISDMEIDEEDEEDEEQETDPTLSTLTVSCVQFTMGGSYHTRTGEQFDWNQWSFDIDLTRYTNEEVRSVFKEMFQTPTDIIISESNSDYTCTVLYNVRRGFGVCLAGQNALVNDYFFIVESTSKSRGMIFGIHQFDIRGADPNLEDTMDNSGQTYDGTSTQYFADERTSSYYKSTCSGGYDEEVELTYVNHYGTCFPEIVSLIELVARFSLGIYVDEEMDQDQYY